jgi:hypothetical protein
MYLKRHQCILAPKGWRSFFSQKKLKSAISSSVQKNGKKIYFWNFNHRIFHKTTRRTCAKSFKKVDYTDWEIITFEVERIVFFACVRQTLTARGAKKFNYATLSFCTIVMHIMLGTFLLNWRSGDQGSPTTGRQARAGQQPAVACQPRVDTWPIKFYAHSFEFFFPPAPFFFEHVVNSCWLAPAHARLAQTSPQNFKHP